MAWLMICMWNTYYILRDPSSKRFFRHFLIDNSYSYLLLMHYFDPCPSAIDSDSLKPLSVLHSKYKVEKTILKRCSEFLKSTFFPYCPLTAQTAQTEEFLFQNVAYWLTVYRTWRSRVLTVHDNLPIMTHKLV